MLTFVLGEADLTKSPNQIGIYSQCAWQKRILLFRKLNRKMNDFIKSSGERCDARQETLKMWEEGASKISAILPLKFQAIHPTCFDKSTANGRLTDISLIKPSELPQIKYVRKPRLIEKLLEYINKNIRRSSLYIDPSKQYLTDASQASEGLCKLSPDEVMEHLGATLDVDEFSLLETITDQDYVFVKINHRCWEEITSIGLVNAGKEYPRRMGAIDHDCIDSGFYEFLAKCIITTIRGLSSRQSVPNQIRLCSESFSFGISLTGGNASFTDDFVGQGRDAKIIKNIYSFVTIGTAAGLTGFFSSIDPGDHRWLVADGSAPKALFWNGEFGEFIKNIAESADAILFIVPPWLSGVTIHDSLDIKVFELVVPGEDIDSMWGLVVPVALQYIANLSSKYRLTVLSQCSVVSALIGMVVDLHLKHTNLRSPFRFYDVGQLMDLANIGGVETGFWLSRKDVRHHASQTDDWSDLLWISGSQEG
jgi:hypothetical protein